jgi:positive phototaxis protein PixI
MGHLNNMQPSTLEFQSLQPIGDPYLKVQLTPQMAAVLPMEQAQEVIAISSDRITPVPNMPVFVLGLLNQRSRVFWAIDLPLMLGLSDQPMNGQQYNLVIIKSGSSPLGLVVPKVQSVLRFNLDKMYSPVGEAPSSLVSFLRGCFSEAGKSLWVLDPEAIIHSPTLSDNC